MLLKFLTLGPCCYSLALFEEVNNEALLLTSVCALCRCFPKCLLWTRTGVDLGKSAGARLLPVVPVRGGEVGMRDGRRW